MVMAVIIRKPSARRHVGRLLFEGEELRRRDGVAVAVAVVVVVVLDARAVGMVMVVVDAGAVVVLVMVVICLVILNTFFLSYVFFERPQSYHVF
ncbi:hypothetical protein E2C01_063182 [Portunus trituberculatus]|uniref:Uncharacterized protein n=1 Tax=Portunus trituberculatus TaxID=210409 RepID=A0A5B7HGT5_PORTR|nr:hypothetical protein [Portunus trituberculatus]